MPDNAIWVVVEVQSGIPVKVKAFSSYKLAYEYSESLRETLNLDNAETGIFKIGSEPDFNITT